MRKTEEEKWDAKILNLAEDENREGRDGKGLVEAGEEKIGHEKIEIGRDRK